MKTLLRNLLVPVLSACLAVSVAIAAPVTVSYGYDAIGRLTAANYSTGQQLGYTYDPAGNMTLVTRSGVASSASLGITTSGSGIVARSPVGTVASTNGDTQSIDYSANTLVTLTAQPAAGASFVGWSGDCSGASTSCTVTLSQARSVVAAFAVSGGVGGGTSPGGGTMLAGTGSATVSGNAPSGGGTVSAAVSGGGSGSWVFTSAAVAPTPSGASLPAGYQFPYGVVDMKLALGQPGSTATVVLTYPAPLPSNTVIWKYGRTSANPTSHWYVLPSGQVAFSADRRSITLTLRDGDIGDDDLSANGEIIDPVAPGVPGGVSDIPTLSEWGAIVLSAAMMLFGVASLRRRDRKPLA